MKSIIRRLAFYIRNFLRFISVGGVVYVKSDILSKGEVLKGKRIIITGGTSGIGYEIAKKFLSEGAKVLITGRSVEKLDKASKQLNGDLYTLMWDVSDFSIVNDKMQMAADLLGGLDILINNAGVYIPKSFFSIDKSNWDEVMNTNLNGVFFLCQAAISHILTNNKGGKIINISSIRGFQGDSGPYGISKWGLNGLTKGLARDLISKNIIVNGIAPGVTASEINGIDPKNNVYFGSEVRNNRVTIPQEIAEIACFLSSDAANSVVGQIIICDGGTTLI